MTLRGLMPTIVLPVALLLSACVTSNGGALQTDYDANHIAQANMRLGVAYMQQGNFEKALEKLQRAREADPGYPTVYSMLGLLFQRMGVADRAEASFNKALSLAPNEYNILNNYGQFLCSQNRFKEAETAFLKAAANPLNSNPARPLTNAGTCASLQGQPAVAEKYFREALVQDPQQPMALLQMAELQYQSGEYLSARGYLQRYSAAAPQSPGSLWLGIRIEDKLGDKNALASYALALESKFPNSEQARLLQESNIR